MEIAKTLNKNSERNMGIELLRIVAMFMIVVHHLLFHGGILDNVCPNTANYYIANILEVICLVCVNLFCLISGYVCLYTKHRYSRIINLWIEVFICSTAIALGIKLFTNYSLSFASLIFSFFPIISNSYWYFTCYFCLFFFMPLLNRAILSTGKNELKLILFIGFITLSFFDFISKINGTLDLGIENGFSLIWFIYLYLCGGYIRKYALDFSTKKYIYLIKYLGFTALSLLFYIANNYLSEYYFNSLGNLAIYSYSAPFVFLASIYLFIFFSNLKISRYRKLFLSFSGISFFVYLISDNIYVRNFFEKEKLAFLADKNSVLFVLNLLLISFIVYVVSTIIGLLTRRVLSFCRVYTLSEKIVSVFKRIYYYFCNL